MGTKIMSKTKHELMLFEVPESRFHDLCFSISIISLLLRILNLFDSLFIPTLYLFISTEKIITKIFRGCPFQSFNVLAAWPHIKFLSTYPRGSVATTPKNSWKPLKPLIFILKTLKKPLKKSFAAMRPLCQEGKLTGILFAASLPHGYAATQPRR